MEDKNQNKKKEKKKSLLTILETQYKSNGWEPVPTSKGEAVKATILANDYIECDFESKRSIEKVFLRAAKIVLNGGRPDDDDEKKKIF